ncbi:unnamed protein product [Sphacelaria rigidula]
MDYTRDPDVLGARAGAAGALTMVSVKDHGKLKSFREYLTGRGKAGIVNLADASGGKLFLLPSSDMSCRAKGENIVVLLRPSGKATGSKKPVGLGLPVTTPLVQAPPPRKTQSPASVRDAGGAGGGGTGGGGGPGIGGFLGSLMGTLNQTHNSVADTAAVDRVSRAQEQAVRQKVDRFKVEVREKLETFATDTDPSVISHTFPHVEKSLRSIQHGLAEDIDGITSRTEGEVDDRHVVVYKLGYEPPEEEVMLDPEIIVSAPSRKSPLPTASLAPMPSIGGGRKGAVAARGAGGTGADAGGSGQGGDHGANSDEGPVREVDLVRIGTIVRDRRTVQDIEEEARQSKRRRGF